MKMLATGGAQYPGSLMRRPTALRESTLFANKEYY